MQDDIVGGPMSKCILVVDDDTQFLGLIDRCLVSRGYTVHTAEGGKEGVRLAREVRPDILVLDCVMPDMDGVATLRMLKADGDLQDIPVIMLTGQKTPHTVIHTIQSGAVEYVEKKSWNVEGTLERLEKAFENILGGFQPDGPGAKRG